MRVKQTLFAVKGFSVTLDVTDGKDNNYGNFFYEYANTSILQYSVYLNLTLHLDERGRAKKGKKEESDIYENCCLSFFDMYALQSAMSNLLEVMSEPIFIEKEKLDEGVVKMLLPELTDYEEVITNVTEKSQVGFKPVMTYNRKTEEYFETMLVMVNRTDVMSKIPIRYFRGIAHALAKLDLHASAQVLLSTYYCNKTAKRNHSNSGKHDSKVIG